MSVNARAIGFCAFATIVCLSPFAHAQVQTSVAEFYKGKTIQIVVGTSAGGGYDMSARALARHMGRHLPGAPTIIVANMPGAGSNIMSAHVANAAPKDGTVIGAPFSTQPLAAILENVTKLRFDPRTLHYLGSATTGHYLCVVRPDAPATRLEDMMSTEVVMGGTAEGGSTGYLPILLNNVIGTKFRVVFGYPGSREITAAIQRGEVHGMCGLGVTTLATQYAGLLKDKQIQILAQESVEGLPELNKQGVPRTGDFAKTDDARMILEIIYSQGIFARPYFVAAETPAARVDALRKAFDETWKDPETLAEMTRMGIEVDPTSGADMHKLLARIYAAPPELLARVNSAIRLKR
jgi:tripartite-type tricarboxylate transporter receptor subunit TctC